jgi:hypothetical protein
MIRGVAFTTIPITTAEINDERIPFAVSAGASIPD